MNGRRAHRRLVAARFVADHWRAQYLEMVKAGDPTFAIGTHPLALVIAAMDGETDPDQLGLNEDVRVDFLRAIGVDR